MDPCNQLTGKAERTCAPFDACTGRMLPDKGDAIVGRAYYLLVRSADKNWVSLSSKDVEIKSIDLNDYGWRAYSICAKCFSVAARDYFFDELYLQLTDVPAEIVPLWPPVLKKENTLETNFYRLYFAIKGETDFAFYPDEGVDREPELVKLREGLKLCKLWCSGFIQMVMGERYGRTLQFAYIHDIETDKHPREPYVKITDDNHSAFNYEKAALPVRNTLLFTPSDDGYVDVYREDNLWYRKELPANQETPVTELKRGMQLQIWIGLERVAAITFPKKKVSSGSSLADSLLVPWRGRMIPFDKRHAWVLKCVASNSELYCRLLEALRTEQIPMDGWNALQKMMEDKVL